MANFGPPVAVAASYSPANQRIRTNTPSTAQKRESSSLSSIALYNVHLHLRLYALYLGTGRGAAPSADPSACNVLDPLQTRPVNAKSKC